MVCTSLCRVLLVPPLIRAEMEMVAFRGHLLRATCVALLRPQYLHDEEKPNEYVEASTVVVPARS